MTAYIRIVGEVSREYVALLDGFADMAVVRFLSSDAFSSGKIGKGMSARSQFDYCSFRNHRIPFVM